MTEDQFNEAVQWVLHSPEWQPTNSYYADTLEQFARAIWKELAHGIPQPVERPSIP
jgi:hypothetical protein